MWWAAQANPGQADRILASRQAMLDQQARERAEFEAALA